MGQSIDLNQDSLHLTPNTEKSLSILLVTLPCLQKIPKRKNAQKCARIGPLFCV